MKKIKTTDAVGYVLCHDITQIIKDVKAGVLFKKGHVVQKEDIEPLLSVGKDHLYIYEAHENMVHENEAAQILYEICKDDKMIPTEVHEGKIEILANCDGLLKVDTQRLQAINELDEIIIATRHNHTVVKTGDKLAGTRVIPLMIHQNQLQKAQKIAADQPLLQIKPFHSFKVGVITTGNEVFYGRIKDTFTSVIEKKLAAYNLRMDYHQVVPDKIEHIQSAIFEALEQGCQLLICTGGMSVDPDDLTPGAIKEAGANILTYGAPVLPGAMLLVGYFKDGTPILGLPGCVMYAKATSFDLIFPRILAKDVMTKQELASLGHGGLCLKCPTCTYPHCEFGK